jgi:hypothetical protein
MLSNSSRRAAYNLGGSAAYSIVKWFLASLDQAQRWF